ncbi:MAG TPA: heavy-metal-associated domain-containing protein [Jiangellales bacterium]|nr:heavy-metal-associated domain-containing protein [Jiangellales bacterium]
MATTTRWTVTGMTCGHCVAAVRDEVGRLDGVTAVEVDLVPAGSSVLTMTSDTAPDEAAVRAAVDEAGYVLVGGPW